jgi:hypothetical protein
MAPCMPAVLADSMMVPVVVSIPCYLHIHHGWAHVSPPGWSHLATVKCHAPTCCWESTHGWPNAFLLGWHSASCWLLGCSTSVTSSFTMDKQLFVFMVGPISLLSNAMHPPMDVGPLLHGHPIPSQCASCWLLLWCPNLGTSTLTMGGAHVSPHGWSYLATAKCHALTCGCETTLTGPPACLLCWLTA